MRFRQASLSVDGKPYELHPNRANTFAEIYVDFQQLETAEKGIRYSVFLHPKQDVKIQNLEIQFDVSLPATARFFANGYQSRSESRLLDVSAQIPRLRRIARPYLGWYGDDYIKNISRGPGKLHSWTYTYFTGSAQPCLFCGSLNERTGFTLFLYDHSTGILTVRKDLDQLALSHSFPALDFWLAEGEEQALFDCYFELAEIQTPVTLPAIGWTSGHQALNQVSEQFLLKNLESFGGMDFNPSEQGAFTPKDSTFNAPIDTASNGINSIPRYFQIDDGWQTRTGDWLSPTPEFPNGMKSIVLKIREKGLSPGIWLAPFIASAQSELVRRHPEWLLKDAMGRHIKVGKNPAWGGPFYALDFYHDGVREYLSGVFHTLLEKWGFEGLKLDFLFAVALVPPPGKTRGGVMWEAMEFLRRLAGTKRIMACSVPLGACFGQVDYCRVSSDVHTAWRNPVRSFLRHRERPETLARLESLLGRWQLNGRAFLLDPDVFILRDKHQKLTPDQQQTLLIINGLLGGLLMTSDDLNDYSAEQKGEMEEAFALLGSRIRRVLELEKEVWSIEFEQAESNWTAYSNLSRKVKNLSLANHVLLELRPFETLILKS